MNTSKIAAIIIVKQEHANDYYIVNDDVLEQWDVSLSWSWIRSRIKKDSDRREFRVINNVRSLQIDNDEDLLRSEQIVKWKSKNSPFTLNLKVSS